jgi:hypothetical protein
VKYGLPVSKQSAKWKKTHKKGPAFPLGSRRQASSARGFAVMMLNKGQLNLSEARSIVSATTSAGLTPAKLVKRDGRYKTVATNPRKESMAKARKRKTSRRVRRTRATPRRSTRKGQARKGARRAYVGTKQSRAARRRRTAKRNPALLRTPAARYSLAALAGAAAAAVLDANAENDGMASRLQIPTGGGNALPAGVTASILTFGITRVFKLKAQTKALGTAMAVGMLAPSAINAARNLAGGVAMGATFGTVTEDVRRAYLAAPAPARVRPVYNSAAVFVDDLIPA